MTLSTAEHDLSRRAAQRSASMLADLRSLVAIPTGMHHAPGLDDTRAWFESRLRALGAAIEHVPGDSRPAWIERAGANSSAPPTAVCRRPDDRAPGMRILLSGHLDTVHDPRGPFRELTLSADGRTGFGPGCADMKGGLVVALHALEVLHEAGVPISWSFVLNSDEEVGSYCSDRALRAEAARHDVGLVFEPALPDGGLVVERPGSGQFYIETGGVAAHVGRDFRKGVSAIVSMAECVRAVHDLVDVDRGKIASIGVIEGGVATNIVPDSCHAWGNVRFKNAEIEAELASGLDDLARPNAVASVRVERSFNRPSKPATPGTMTLAEMARDVAQGLGQQLPFGSTGGVCDGNTLQAAGLPTIDTLGVRGGGLHTTDEWIEVASLVERCQLASVLLARLASRGGPTRMA
ncbi:MAG: M20/M25/M40 family metallo-hydrolase [Planctomycetota bacterium]|nr:M20/M25/M40 family metallo-hydrolase [Planctomycetota bacterium]